MQLSRALSVSLAVMLAVAQGAAAGDVLPDTFTGWFAPASQSCATQMMIEVTATEMVSGDDVQRIARVEVSPRFPGWIGVSLQTVGGVGTEEVLLELADDGQDLRVLFGDGTWIAWHRCL